MAGKKEIYVPRNIINDFTEMRAIFGSTFFKVQAVIEKCDLSIECLREFVEYSYPDLALQLSASKSIKEVLCLVQKKCSLIDIKLLEKLVDEFEQLKEAEQHIKTYKEAIDKFCEKMSTRLCLEQFTPLQCETATFVLDWNPDDHMLNDVKDLLAATFDKLSIINVKIVVIKEGNSAIVECTFPVHVCLAMLVIVTAFNCFEVNKML